MVANRVNVNNWILSQFLSGYLGKARFGEIKAATALNSLADTWLYGGISPSCLGRSLNSLADTCGLRHAAGQGSL